MHGTELPCVGRCDLLSILSVIIPQIMKVLAKPSRSHPLAVESHTVVRQHPAD
jgi:hypothetical protein